MISLASEHTQLNTAPLETFAIHEYIVWNTLTISYYEKRTLSIHRDLATDTRFQPDKRTTVIYKSIVSLSQSVYPESTDEGLIVAKVNIQYN